MDRRGFLSSIVAALVAPAVQFIEATVPPLPKVNEADYLERALVDMEITAVQWEHDTVGLVCRCGGIK